MRRLLEYLIWLVIVGALGVSAYFGYRMWEEQQSSGTTHVRYAETVIPRWSWEDITQRPALSVTLGAGQPMRWNGCQKFLELTYPRAKKVWDIGFSPSARGEKECLRKRPIYVFREGKKGYVLPGQAGAFLVSGHRDTHFSVFEDIMYGDYVVINDTRSRYIYQLRSYRTVAKEKAEFPPSEPQNRISTLYISTCYPFTLGYVGHAPQRRIFRFELVGREVGTPFINETKGR